MPLMQRINNNPAGGASGGAGAKEGVDQGPVAPSRVQRRREQDTEFQQISQSYGEE